MNNEMTSSPLPHRDLEVIQEWKAPAMIRIDVKRTLLGPGSSSDGGQPTESIGIPGGG